MGKNVPASVYRNIKHYFGFLPDRGYEIRDASYDYQNFGNWEVVLESANCIIAISSDRNEINLVFSPVIANRKYRIEIRAMVFFLSQGQNYIGTYEGNLFWGKGKQCRRLAKLLKEYIDQISPYFGSDFEKYKRDLILAQNKYNYLSFQKYALKIRAPNKTFR